MEFESFVSEMMSMNTYGRLWHWGTDSAQHHVTYEKFLTQNETFTDSFVESLLGNEVAIKLEQLAIKADLKGGYSLSSARTTIDGYRKSVRKLQEQLGGSDAGYNDELATILDDVNELCSKTLYLLSLK